MVMAGYKKTVVGIIPEDWEVNTIESASERVGDVDHRMPQSVDFGIPYIMTGDFFGINGMNFANAKKISIEDYYLLSRKIRPEKGDIIFARYASVGAVRYVETEKPFIISYSCVIIKPAASCNAVYLYYLFQSASIQKQINFAINTGTQKNVGIDSLKNFFLPLPQYFEQTAIATALSDADAYIAVLEKLIAKKRAIKQSAMQELLTGKRRLPGFEGEWAEKTLGEIGWLSKESINPQLAPTATFVEYSMPAYDNNRSPQNVMGRSMHSNRLHISSGVLLFNKLNVRQRRVWHISSCPENAVCSSEFLPYYSDKADMSFLCQLLMTDKVTLDFEGMSTGTSNSQKRITPNNFLEYKVLLPPTKDEQTAIATVLFDMDAEILALTAKLEKALRIKQGMMSELLTGRIRLIEGKLDNGEN